MTRSKFAIVEEFLEAVWNEARLDAIDRFLAEEYFIRHDPGDPWDGQRLTRDAFKNRVSLSRSPFPDQRFTVIDHSETDDQVFITWSWRATHQGEIASFAPSGREIRMTGATVYDFAGDRICGHWQIADRLGVYQQLAASGDNTNARI